MTHMPEPEDILSGLPDNWRSSNRPIVIYQGGPPPYVDTPTSSTLGLLSWLALVTLCVGVAGICAWMLWNPGFDRSQFSPIYAEGRPVGVLKQIEERQQINAWADRLTAFRDQVRGNNDAHRIASPTHPLLTDRQGISTDLQGIDPIREQWDAMCANIRARIYDRRMGVIDSRAADLRRQRARAIDSSERTRLDGELQQVKDQRSAEIIRRQTDSEPSLRCTPATQAPVCSESDDAPWCNPQFNRPLDFTDEEQ